MAREHARIWLDINDDDDFQTLSFDAQGFYTRIILTDPTLNYCGVFDWRPRRLTSRAPDLTLDRIQACAAELEARNYLLFDIDTEEGLARSYIRRDELIRNPKMAATVIKAFPAVASKTLRAAIVTELQRIHEEHRDYSSWSHKDTGAALSKLLAKTPLEKVGYTPQISITSPVENTYWIPVRNGYPYQAGNTIADPVENPEPDLGAEHQSFSVRNPSTSTIHPSPAPLSGYVTGERHQGAETDSDDLPPPYCSKHPTGTAERCRDCGAARQHRETLAEQRATAEAEARARFLDEIADCPDCDELGWVNVGNAVQRCPKHHWETTDA